MPSQAGHSTHSFPYYNFILEIKFIPFCRELNEKLLGTCPPIAHWFDIWHMIKSIMKDVWEAAKLKKCAALNLWSASVNNMLWWSFSSSKG